MTVQPALFTKHLICSKYSRIHTFFFIVAWAFFAFISTYSPLSLCLIVSISWKTGLSLRPNFFFFKNGLINSLYKNFSFTCLILIKFNIDNEQVVNFMFNGNFFIVFHFLIEPVGRELVITWLCWLFLFIFRIFEQPIIRDICLCLYVVIEKQLLDPPLFFFDCCILIILDYQIFYTYNSAIGQCQTPI